MGNNDPATFAVSEEGLAVYLPADPPDVRTGGRDPTIVGLAR